MKVAPNHPCLTAAIRSPHVSLQKRAGMHRSSLRTVFHPPADFNTAPPRSVWIIILPTEFL
jgi:hypothetical protein